MINLGYILFILNGKLVILHMTREQRTSVAQCHCTSNVKHNLNNPYIPKQQYAFSVFSYSHSR